MMGKKNGFQSASRNWVFFLVFFISLVLLSYLHLSLAWKLWICLMGILLPLGSAALFSKSSSNPPPVLTREWLPSPPFWLWLVLGGIMLALRLFKPLSFIPWPLWDEAANGYFALRLDQHWSWSPFFFYSQLPPFFIWLLLLLYKGLGSFLTAIRLEPLLISLLILPAAYGAARAFFSKSFSLLYLLLVGFGFWALFFGRISHQGVLLLLWEYFALFALGKSLAAAGPNRNRWLALLGFLLGTGFYTYFSWPLVVIWLGSMSLLAFPRKEGRLAVFLCFFLPMVVFLAPLVFSIWTRTYGGYFQMLWSAKNGNDWLLQAQNTFACLASFLWGHASPDFYYGPVWGGFFNPLMGATFFLGTIGLFRQQHRREAKAFWLGLPLFLCPAFLTNTLTDMREIQVLPLMAFAAALGLGTLCERLQPKLKILFLGAFLLASTALDLNHLLRFESFMGQFLENQKTDENAQAFHLLDQVQQKQGPGLILTAFGNDLYDYDLSLPVAAYPFNAASNPRLSPGRVHWLALVTNIHFEPFLAREFPEAHMAWLSDPTQGVRDNYNGGLMLVVVPLTSSNLPRLRGWVETDRFFREISAQMMSKPTGLARREILGALAQALPTFPTDRFLRSCYWDLVYTGLNWENRYDNRDEKENLPGAILALQRALREGYPTAYFYNELGSCYALTGDKAKSRWAFEKAVHSPLNLTPAEENLKALETMGQTLRPSGAPKD